MEDVETASVDSMDGSSAKAPAQHEANPSEDTHRRTAAGSGLLSKLPFMRHSQLDGKTRQDDEQEQQLSSDSSRSSPSAMTTVIQQQKSRRRRGSLRKVALLGRGAQRERRDSKPLTIDTSGAAGPGMDGALSAREAMPGYGATGLGVSDLTPRSAAESRASLTNSLLASTSPPEGESNLANSAMSYNSTTDEEDLHMPGHNGSSFSSGSESYYGNRAAAQPLRRRSLLQAKSPLSYTGLASTPMPAADPDWDYSDTEWWGWVVLIVTWLVFVIGMGSCLGVWSWAWDVGTTPYAPPELEDDPTLPIVGYYPALIILTCIMAWVWVTVAWVGMKYFRHAKISGD